MTLSLYFARRFLMTFLAIAAGFFVILYLIDMIEEIRKVGDAPGALGRAAGLAGLKTPGTLYQVLPLCMVLTSITLFLRLARSSELVAARAAGRSALRTLAAPVVTAFACGLLAVAVANPFVAATTKRYQALSAAAEDGADSTASFGAEGLWIRQGDAQGQWVIHADAMAPDGGSITGASFMQFGATGGPLRRIEATTATLKDGAWLAKDAKDWHFTTDTNPEAAALRQADLRLDTDLTPDRIRDSLGAPQTVPVWDLPEQIAALERAGFSARAYAVWLQMELALPLFLAAMVLIGAGFTMRHVRFGRTGLFVLMALVSGIALFFVRNFAQVLGESGQIPVLLAAWSPPVAAILLATSLLLHLEDG